MVARRDDPAARSARASRHVHFVYLGGPFEWPHWRAIETAKVHDAPIIVWYATEPTGECWEQILPDVQTVPLELPDWLRDHPIQLANVKDLYAWSLLWWGGNPNGVGLYLDLDTISLRPAWDLLTRDVCVSLEYPTIDGGTNPYNSAAILARAGAPILAELRDRCWEILEGGEARWGKCGPHLLTDAVRETPKAFDVAPFRSLNGWNDETIRDYYAGARPGPDVRVVHLFSSSNMDAFLADCWMP